MKVESRVTAAFRVVTGQPYPTTQRNANGISMKVAGNEVIVLPGRLKYYMYPYQPKKHDALYMTIAAMPSA
jgi:hypothetical protein